MSEGRWSGRRRWPEAALMTVTAAGFAFAIGVRWQRRGVVVEDWPRVEHVELELDVSRPPELRAVARVDLAEVRTADVPLLLNASLEVTSAERGGGETVRWSTAGRLRSDYHSEGRVVRFALGAPPQDGRARLTIAYAGRGLDGSEERDWMGVLLLAPDELRMSEQTVFYPQVPRSADGPAKLASTARVRVLAPAELEVFVPGRACESGLAADGARAWCFELARPGTLAVLAGRYVRHELERRSARVVTLLFEEHAELAEELTATAARALDFFASAYGPSGEGALGIVEIAGRGASYNWAQEGVVTFDRLALGNGVPVDSVAHEVAHLWWGQAVASAGAGERFLTESMAEHASWRFLEHERGADAGRERARAAHRDWVARVHDEGSDAPLAEVTFATKGYSALAYAKGPLALRDLEERMGRAGFDRALADYAARGAEQGGSLALFRECIARAAGDAEVAMPWLERAGHAHLGLEDVAFDEAGGRVRARIVARECPAGIAALLPERVVLDVRSRARSERLSVALEGSGAEIAFDHPAAPEWIGFERDAFLVAETAPAVLGGARVVRTAPPDGARDVPLGEFELRIELDRELRAPGEAELRAIQRATLDAARGYDVAAGPVGAVALAAGDARTLVLSVVHTQPSATHVVVVPAELSDAFGIPLPETRVRFTVASADGHERPRIVETVPACGALGVPLDTRVLRVVFSKPMRSGQGFKTSDLNRQRALGREFPSMDFARWIDARTAEFPLESALLPSTTYALPFRQMFRDELGVPLEDYDYWFTTADR